ncbi:MAG: hypothetical protein KAG97_06170, partial [Victivallales bacterium]|nr:hypothetical protein [Victivallales bacterium]
GSSPAGPTTQPPVAASYCRSRGAGTKMRLFIPLLLAMPILLSSCSSVMPEFGRLNPGEYASLVKRCAKIVGNLPVTGKDPVSKEDKAFV